MNGALGKISILLMIGLIPSMCPAFSSADRSDTPSKIVNTPRQEVSEPRSGLAVGSIANDRSMGMSAEAIREWLQGYNYAVVWNSGKVQRILVSGKNDSGTEPTESNPFGNEAGQELINYQLPTTRVPGIFEAALPGSVRPIDVPISRLLGMALGEAIPLKLPIGEFRVVHDNRYTHENGDITWIGYLDEVGKGYRVILTIGSQGAFGQIVSPDGAFDIVFEDGRNWLLDLGAMGFLAGGSEADGMAPESLAQMNSSQGSQISLDRVASGKAVRAKPNTANQISARMREGAQVIDVMMLYPKGVAKAKLDSRVNYLVAKANQAYIDSGVNMVLRVVARELVKYGTATSNADALNELSSGLRAFSKVSKLRRKYGADLVSLIRPFRYGSQKNCGIAWVNGANGGALDPSLAYSVVSDGFDPSGWYCSDFTFAHELGHNMGSVHDRQHSSFSGVFPFSYGHGQAGKFGTIMSYFDPVVGLFSSPKLTCVDQACGDEEYADNVRSLNSVAPAIAAFQSAEK